MTNEQLTQIAQFADFFTSVDIIAKHIKSENNYSSYNTFVSELKNKYNNGLKKCALTAPVALATISNLYDEINRLNQRLDDGMGVSSAQDELVKIRKLLEENLAKSIKQTEEL